MAIKIQGNGVNYTFPSGRKGNANIRDYSRAINIESRDIRGKDGVTTDPRSIKKEAVTIWVEGVLKSYSMASAVENFRELANAVNMLSGEVNLVNTDEDIQIPVRMVNFEYPRMPSKICRYAIKFQADKSYWESRDWTEKTFTNQKIVDVEIGNAPVYPKIFIDGEASNITMVQGNWSFCAHMGELQAQAITHNDSVDPYGEIDGTAAGTIKPSKYGYGREFAGSTMSFGNLYQRRDRFSWNVKVQPNWCSNASHQHTIFDFVRDGSEEDDYYNLYIDDTRLVFGSDSTISAPLSAFATSDNVEFAGWYDSAGTSIAGTTYYGKLFQDGEEIGSSQSTIRASESTLDKLVVGSRAIKRAKNYGSVLPFKLATKLTESNLISGSVLQFRLGSILSATATKSGTVLGMILQAKVTLSSVVTEETDENFDGLIDEVYFFNQNMGDNFCKGETISGKQLEADNTTFAWASTIASNDYLMIDMESYDIKLFDVSGNSTTNEIDHMNGNFFRFGIGDAKTGHSQSKLDTLTFGTPVSGRIQYRKTYN